MEAADSNTISLKIREPPINKVLHPTLQGTGRKTCYRYGKAGHFLANAALRMHIVMLAARRDTLRWCAERYLRKGLPRRRDKIVTIVNLLR